MAGSVCGSINANTESSGSSGLTAIFNDGLANNGSPLAVSGTNITAPATISTVPAITRPSESSASSGSGKMIAGVVAAIVIIIAMVGAYYCCCRSKNVDKMEFASGSAVVVSNSEDNLTEASSYGLFPPGCDKSTASAVKSNNVMSSHDEASKVGGHDDDAAIMVGAI